MAHEDTEIEVYRGGGVKGTMVFKQGGKKSHNEMKHTPH